ncbi:MAG: DNA alkylation repair protein [Alphaproteobacteria bacterium]|nr:DNA alkylation repair protein [Alphaproteobacteria bacterium]MCB9794813.1 DNA alkylation repair protein [Alphaproteobacteria bacterium]
MRAEIVQLVSQVEMLLQATCASHPSNKLVETSLPQQKVSTPGVRQVVKALHQQFRVHQDALLLEAALQVVEAPKSFEARQVMYELLGRRKTLLRSLDEETLERLGQGNDNWRSVDVFGPQVSGVAWRLGAASDALFHRWARSPNLWWRRTALVSTLGLNQRARGGKGDPARTYALCVLLVNDRERMVIKALSWALRELVPHDAVGLTQFIDEHESQLNALVVRETRKALEKAVGA